MIMSSKQLNLLQMQLVSSSNNGIFFNFGELNIFSEMFFKIPTLCRLGPRQTFDNKTRREQKPFPKTVISTIEHTVLKILRAFSSGFQNRQNTLVVFSAEPNTSVLIFVFRKNG